MFATIWSEVTSLYYAHIGTIKGVGGLTLAAIASAISSGLTILVLSLTAYNLWLEIRKKKQADKKD